MVASAEEDNTLMSRRQNSKAKKAAGAANQLAAKHGGMLMWESLLPLEPPFIPKVAKLSFHCAQLPR